jgi:hypothetical protein
MADSKPTDDLALRAYLYSSGELNDGEREAFERQLAVDQAARDALADAVQMSALATGASPRPDPAYRARVRLRLRPVWWRRVFARRNYRGHPLLWIVAGAAASLLLSLTILRPAPEVRVIETPVVQSPADGDDSPDDALQGAAFIWAELSNAEHAVKSHAEESRRKARAGDRRQVRQEMNPPADQ